MYSITFKRQHGYKEELTGIRTLKELCRIINRYKKRGHKYLIVKIMTKKEEETI